MADTYTLDEIRVRLYDLGYISLGDTIESELAAQRAQAEFARRVKEYYGRTFDEVASKLPPGFKLERRWAENGDMFASTTSTPLLDYMAVLGGTRPLAVAYDNVYGKNLNDVAIQDGFVAMLNGYLRVFRVPNADEKWVSASGAIRQGLPTTLDKRRLIVVPYVPARIVITYTRTETPGVNAIKRNGVFYQPTAEWGEG